MGVIFLNGCTSAGKSSIAKSLQKQLSAPHLLTGIDDAFAILPTQLHNNSRGFFFDRSADGHVRLNFGEYGLATLKSHYRSSAAIANSGANLILDEVILTSDLRNDWLHVLENLDVFWVGVHCDLEELERREIARGDRMTGQARGQFNIVHTDMTYNLEVDTTNTVSSACATQIINALSNGSVNDGLS